MTLYEKKLKKIRLSLEKFALKGKDNYMDFHKYVDELVEKGDYNPFIEVLYTYYFFDGLGFRNVDEMKRLAWKEICFQTSAPFLKKLKKVYDDRKVYQNSFDIYSTNFDNINLSVSSPLSYTFSTTSATSSLDLTKENDGSVNLVSLRDNLYSFKLYAANWITENGISVPSRETEYMNVLMNDRDEVKTDITLDSIRQWWIYTEERQNLLKGYTYSNFVVSTTSTASISWTTDLDAIGYVLNISTSSTFDTTLREYTSLRFGTSSGGDYIIDGMTASLSLYDLPPYIPGQPLGDYLIQPYYYSIRNTLVTYTGNVTTTGTTASFVWPSNNLADAYSLDVSTYSNFEYILPGYNYILGTISTTSSYITGLNNKFIGSGLTAGTYYYRARALYGNTQSDSFFVSEPYATATWSTLDIATDYKFELSKSSTFSSIVQSFKLGTQSDIYGYDISGNTASLLLQFLDSDEVYYYRVNVYKGKNVILNYKIDMTQNTYLGQIYEREVFTPDVKFYKLNKQFASIIGARKTYLEVYKVDSLSPSGYATASIFAYDDQNLTEEQNLIVRYSQAVDYLNS